MSNFREKVQPISGTRFTKCAFQDAFFALPAVLASEVGYTGRTVNQKRLAPESLIHLVPTTFPMGFSWARFFLSRRHGPLHALGKY